MTTDPRIDSYIANAQDFAKPVMVHLRKLVHTACPDAEETIKWGFPHFVYKKQILCSMAAFKAHCAFIFHHAELLGDTGGLLQVNERTAMGHLGKITKTEEIPANEVMISLLKHAADIIDSGKPRTSARAKTTEKKEIEVPGELLELLKTNEKAFSTFTSFSYSNRKEYTEWIAEAKSEATRQKRLATAIEWLSEGKPYNWRYLKPAK